MSIGKFTVLEKRDWPVADRDKVSHGVQTAPCFCVGPQNGQPLCPCRMRGVIIRDGRYILPEQDLGPVE